MCDRVVEKTKEKSTIIVKQGGGCGHIESHQLSRRSHKTISDTSYQR